MYLEERESVEWVNYWCEKAICYYKPEIRVIDFVKEYNSLFYTCISGGF